jgi:hypothetical protein
VNRTDVAAIVAIVVATAAVAVAVLVRGRRRADLSDVLAGRIAAHPVPVEDIYDGLGLYIDTLTGGHDRYPFMSDGTRRDVIGWLDQSWALPARERTS